MEVSLRNRILLLLMTVYVALFIILVYHFRLAQNLDLQPIAFTVEHSTKFFTLTKNYWSRADQNSSFFSAYFDDRRRPCLQLLGAHKGEHYPLYCQAYYPDGAKPCMPLTVQYFTPTREIFSTRYQPYRYICPLKRKDPPYFVRVFDNSECLYPWGNSTLTPVAIPGPENRRKFGVCVGDAVHREQRLEQVVPMLESNRFLGSEWFTLYVKEAKRKVIAALKLYEQLDFGEVVDSWGDFDAPSLWPEDERTLLHNDCLYRNMFRVDYLIATDFDELIVPNKAIDWDVMMRQMEDIEEEPHIAFLFHYRKYIPSGNFYRTRLVPGNISRCDNDRVLPVPRLLEYNRMATSGEVHGQGKVIVKPKSVDSISVRNILKTRFSYPRLKILTVPTEVGTLRHYSRAVKSRESAPDTNGHTLELDLAGQKLMSNIKNMICIKMREFL